MHVFPPVQTEMAAILVHISNRDSWKLEEDGSSAAVCHIHGYRLFLPVIKGGETQMMGVISRDLLAARNVLIYLQIDTGLRR